MNHGWRGKIAACIGTELWKGLRMKRYVETEQWNDPWFRKLPGRHKLAWLFLRDAADACGMVRIDEELWAFMLGVTKMDWPEFFKAIEGRTVRLPEGELWIPQVVKEHYGPLSFECRYHLKVIEFLRRHDLVNHPMIDWKSADEKLMGSAKRAMGSRKCVMGSEPIRKNNNSGGLASDNPREKQGKRLVKPSVDDIAQYCADRNNNLDANQIFDHYEACGWVQGRAGKPIRDWRAAVRTWEKKRFNDGVIPFQGRTEVDPVAETKNIDQSIAEDRKRRRELEQYNGPGILAELRSARQTQG